MNGQDGSLQNKVLFLQFLLGVLLAVLILRLFYLQVMQGEYYRQVSENNYTRNIVLRSPRGMLTDRNGMVLCRNRVSFSLLFDTARPGSIDDNLYKMQRYLGITMTREELNAALARSPVRSLAVIARDVPPSWLEKVEAHQDELKMLRIEMELRREYPYGTSASHALGYVGLMPEEDFKKLPESERDPFIEVGKAGVEKTSNALLMGKNGLRKAQVNSLGREVEDPRLKLPGVGIVKEPLPGKRVKLCMDYQLQQILETALLGETGSAVFMNPKTGEILAWVSVPGYDPNLFSRAVSVKDWKALSEDPAHPLLNRPIQGTYPAGSTFKPFVALVGLEEGLLQPSTSFYCNGAWEFGGNVFHCHAKGGHGSVDLMSAIQNSCNVFFYHAGDRIGIDRLYKWGHHFGLGQKTGVDMPNEISGVLPSPQWKQARQMGPWYAGETLSVSIGQGYLTVTPLQLLSFYSTLATGGVRVRPHLAEGPTEVMDSTAISPSTLAVVKEALWRVVEAGTAQKMGKISGFQYCAKTGTAQVVKASSGKNTNELDKEIRDHAWFAGFAPKEDPTVAFVIMVEHGGHGGNIGAEIARVGLEYLFFGVKPEPPKVTEPETPGTQPPKPDIAPSPNAPLQANLLRGDP